VLGSSSCSKYTKNSCTSTDIKNNLIFKVLRITFNCVSVSIGANFVLKHLLVDIEVRVAAEVIIVFFFIVLQVLCNLLFELNVIEPCLRLAGESLLGGRCMRFATLVPSLIVRLLVAVLMVSSFLFLLLHFHRFLSSRWRGDDGRGNHRGFLHLNIIMLLLFLVMLSTSVTLFESTSVLLASLVAIVGIVAIVAIASVRFSARLYFLEIFHLVYIPTIILY
jgi:hypothetical protein